jgi:hypothetical protein
VFRQLRVEDNKFTRTNALVCSSLLKIVDGDWDKFEGIIKSIEAMSLPKLDKVTLGLLDAQVAFKASPSLIEK